MAGAEKVYQKMVSMCLMPFHLLRSSHYYEPSSPHQPPLVDMYTYVYMFVHVWVCGHTCDDVCEWDDGWAEVLTCKCGDQ
jgi:hypothetical protein